MLPRSRNPPSDEKTALFFSVASTASRLATMNMPGMASMTCASTSFWYRGWGQADSDRLSAARLSAASITEVLSPKSLRAVTSGDSTGARLPRCPAALDKSDAISHTPKVISLGSGVPMTTYTPATVELADDSPEAMFELFDARGLGDGLPLVPPTPRARRRHARARRPATPTRCSSTLLPRAGHRHAARRRDQRGARRVPARGVPGRAHRGARARPPEVNLRGVNATTHLVAPMVIVHGEIATQCRVQRRASARSGPATAPTPPSGAPCGWCCCTSPAPSPGSGDAATHGQPAKYTFCAAENLDESPWEGYAASRGVDAAERRHRALRRGPAQRARRRGRTATPQLILDKIASAMTSLGHEQRADQPGRVLRGPRARARARASRAAGSRATTCRCTSTTARACRRRVFRRHFEELAWAQWMKTVRRRPPRCR